MTKNFAGNHATAGIGIEVPAGSADPTIDPLITDAEGAAMLNCSKATWWRRVADGTIPPAIKIGGMSRWKRSDAVDVIERAAANRAV